ELPELCREPVEQRPGSDRLRLVAVRYPPADPEPAARLVEDRVGDERDAGQREAQLIGAQPTVRHLDGEDRTAVVGDGELGQRELVVPAELRSIRLEQDVAPRRSEVLTGATH